MSGIYIHVPYCKRKCHYCDFFSVEDARGMNEFANLILEELRLRKDYLPTEPIETVYFGGGTPSLLTADRIATMLNGIAKTFSISPLPEITLEANPDDLNPGYIRSLLDTGINRLSLGVQSFDDNDLQQLGRRHNAKQATKAVNMASQLGFNNISIDLIYGLPYATTSVWESNLRKAFRLPIQHLSCYHIIYEEGTPLQRKVFMGRVTPVDEAVSVEQFDLLHDLASQNGFIHYEISNLGKEDYFSRHNTAYWQQIPYLGLGPSAHSYNKTSRAWNPRSVDAWINAIKKGSIEAENELLSEKDILNEYLLTSLRTIWGIDNGYIAGTFGIDQANRIERVANKYMQLEILEKCDSNYRIKPKKFIVSDGVIADFLTE